MKHFVAYSKSSRYTYPGDIYDLEHFSLFVRREGSKMGSECSPKVEVLQDSAFEKNVVYEVNFQSVYPPIDWIFPIRRSSHFSFIRLSPIVLSDAFRLKCNS